MNEVIVKSERGTFFGLAIYGDFIFWSDWARQAVLRSNKFTGGDTKVLRANIPQPMGIVAVASDTNNLSHTQQCEEGHIACPSGKCISSVWLCDGQKDCEDGADEFQCAPNNTCDNTSFRCLNKACIPQRFVCDHDDDCGDGSDDESVQRLLLHVLQRPQGAVCDGRSDCGDGSDERNCNVNECLNRRCLCVDGYEALERNPNMCKALSAEEPFLIMADHHEIRKLSVDGSNYTILKQPSDDLGAVRFSTHDTFSLLLREMKVEVEWMGMGVVAGARDKSPGLNNIIHIDFDYRKELIYWVDSTRPSGRTINRMRLNGSDLKIVHKTAMPSALAVDWIGKNLYSCDMERKTMEVSKANGLYPIVLISAGIKNPTDLVLDPQS
ncbi:hypothetical protein CRUP_038075, partial [Coryphaenoides rupestris]